MLALLRCCCFQKGSSQSHREWEERPMIKELKGIQKRHPEQMHTNCCWRYHISSFLTGDSHHLPTFAIRYKQNINDCKKACVSFCDKNTAKIAKFHELLRSTDWSNIYNFTNVNTAPFCFLNKYAEILTLVFP